MSELVGMFEPDSYRFRSPDGRVDIHMTRFRSDSRGLRAEVDVRWNERPLDGLLKSSELNLLADRSVKSWANELEDRVTYDWYATLTAACWMAKEHFRHGDEPVDLTTVPPSERSRWVIRPWVDEERPTILAAKGGTLKSLFALAMAATVATGRGRFLGINPVLTSPVLYVDWEAGVRTHANRLGALAAGSGLDVPADLVHYRHEHGVPLYETVDSLAHHVRRLGVGFVVLDSRGAAMDGPPEEAQPTLRLFQSIAKLRVPTLIVDHVTNERARGKGGKRPFGSVYAWNSAGNIWYGEAASTEGRATVLWEHVKANNGPVGTRFAWQVTLDQGADGWYRSIRFTPSVLQAVTPMMEGQPAREQIWEYLDGVGEPRSNLEIAEALGIPESSVRARMTELRVLGRVFGEDGVWVAKGVREA